MAKSIGPKKIRTAVFISGTGSNLKNLIKYEIKLIDDFNIDGDFIESQAFAYLSIRSYLKKPISYPGTTNVNIPVTGGEIIINY